MNSSMADLRVITGLKGLLLPLVEASSLDAFKKTISLTEIEDMAMQQRPDLQFQDQEFKYAGLDLKYEQRSRVPDAVFNVATDQRGGAFRNQVNFGVSIGLPVLNLNRGHIIAAKSELQSSGYLLEQKKLELRSEVLEAYLNMQRSVSEYEKVKTLYDENFDGMLKSVTDNFSRRNLSLIEFVDFLESYSDGIKELERIKSQIAINAARINYVTATKLF
jgi:cobalt-zinc-cadmium efflux system outer membrane protein